ncbi:hypothetical protein P43SY_009223 [Pythium insidiosum]|uniref:Uncharacterized protein n=1 Tax=Pythium insidiosum TaxID=114742 RepID=A0AAD5QBS0_PYTIN|nr:hypothetical protein P43SY_009223 [Pythium insidiosum]
MSHHPARRHRAANVVPEPATVAGPSAAALQPPATATAPLRGPRASARVLRLVFALIDAYTLVSFVLTSSLLQPLYPETSVFVDDLMHGVYDFAPRAPIEELLVRAFDGAKTLWNRDVITLGYQDARHNAFRSASHCHRLATDLGTTNAVTYYGDDKARRVITKFHGRLPGTCTAFTVPLGENYTSRHRVAHVNDARLVMGQSFLHCTGSALWGPQTFNSSQATQTNNTVFDFKATYVIVQQHYANAHFGVECQLSYCRARKVAPDVDYWSVEVATPGDTKAHVAVVFTSKFWLLGLLDTVGQTIIAATMARELARVFRYRSVSVVELDLNRHAVSETIGNTLSWLSSPFYMIGCLANAIGTTTESQMVVEVLYWQYTRSGNVMELVYAGMYSMRHAWVGMLIHAMFSYFMGWLEGTRCPVFVATDDDDKLSRTRSPPQAAELSTSEALSSGGDSFVFEVNDRESSTSKLCLIRTRREVPDAARNLMRKTSGRTAHGTTRDATPLSEREDGLRYLLVC